MPQSSGSGPSVDDATRGAKAAVSTAVGSSSGGNGEQSLTARLMSATHCFAWSRHAKKS